MILKALLALLGHPFIPAAPKVRSAGDLLSNPEANGKATPIKGCLISIQWDARILFLYIGMSMASIKKKLTT